MNDKYFLDTNVFVYTFDASAKRKQRIANNLVCSGLNDGRGVISFQVVQEFCSLATRKFSKLFSTGDLREYIESVLAPLCEIHSSISMYKSCINIQAQTQYSFYDSMILTAAAQSGCEILYSEDLHDGHIVAGVKIVNPF